MTHYNQLALLFREIIGVKYLDYRDAYFAIAQILLSVGAWPITFLTMRIIIQPKSKIFISERVKKKNPIKSCIKHCLIYGFTISFIFGVFFFASFMKHGYEMLWLDWYLRFIFVGFVIINLSLWISFQEENIQKIGMISKIVFVIMMIPYVYADSMISTGVYVPLWIRKVTGFLFYFALPANCAFTRYLTRGKIIFYVVAGVLLLLITYKKWKKESK